MTALSLAHAKDEAHAKRDEEEIMHRLKRASRGDPVKGFTKTTRMDMMPYSLLIVPALASRDPAENLMMQYRNGVERTIKVLNRLSGRVRIFIPEGEDFKVYAWAYDDKSLMFIFRFGNSVRILDPRPEVEPIFIKIESDKLKIGSRVHYRTMMWREVDRADIYISPIGHTPVLLNTDAETPVDPARSMWVYLNKGASAVTRRTMYELRGAKFVGAGEKKIIISPFFDKVSKRHSLPAFVREMLN